MNCHAQLVCKHGRQQEARALGFGAVLTLTLILAWSGWGSLGGVIQRSSWMTDMSQLNKTLTDLRIARLQFMLANGDSESTARLDKNLSVYIAQQTELLHLQASR
ncbi:hypothetical protein SSTU70S_04035 [Stutzerimonas stutzeri]